MKVTIEVTQECIKRGRRHDTCNCPVALAINRLLAVGYRSDVGYTSAGIRQQTKPRGPSWEITLPNVGRQIVAFDRGEKIDPFTFTLDLPAEVLK